jgi:putative tricarboxylic transport membrane protein
MLDAFLALGAPATALTLMIGLIAGIIVGALPGLTGGMLMALSLPFTYYMPSTQAVVMLIAMYVGGVSGGLITATLMRIPGEPASVMTTLDGYPLARRGYPGRAIGLGVAASLVGGALSWVALVTIAPPLARIGLAFGPFETFALVVMALVLIASLSQGSLLKGLMAGLLGMLVAMPGVDESSGTLRLTFGFHSMDAGLNILPVIIGVFALSQIIADVVNIEQKSERVEAAVRGVFIALKDYVVHGLNMLRSAFFGIVIGILPGVGASISSIVAYTVTKNMSKEPEKFGTGHEPGIVSSETANNACTGGTLIPIISLGIPGGLADAVLLSALMIHNLQPGPLLMVNNPGIVHTIMATHLVAHILMFAVMTVGVVVFARIMDLHRGYIFPLILVACVVGSLAVNNRMFEVWVMLAFGVVGYFMELARVPLAPFAIGLVLSPFAEGQLRSGLMASGGSLMPLVERPIAASFLLVAALMLAWPFVSDWRRRRAVVRAASA